MHDIVLVGGSAGALEGVVTLVQGRSDSPQVAASGDSIRHGVVYLPPPHASGRRSRTTQ